MNNRVKLVYVLYLILDYLNTYSIFELNHNRVKYIYMEKSKRNYKVNFVGENEYFLLTDEMKDNIKEYRTVKNRIDKMEMSLIKMKKDMIIKKEKVNEYKKIKNKLFDLLEEYHEEFVPTVGVSLNKQGQWVTNIRVNGLNKSYYIGTNRNVCNRLNEIKDVDIFHEVSTEKVKVEIEKIMFINVLDSMETLRKERKLKTFHERKWKPMVYWLIKK